MDNTQQSAGGDVGMSGEGEEEEEEKEEEELGRAQGSDGAAITL